MRLMFLIHTFTSLGWFLIERLLRFSFKWCTTASDVQVVVSEHCVCLRRSHRLGEWTKIYRPGLPRLLDGHAPPFSACHRPPLTFPRLFRFADVDSMMGHTAGREWKASQRKTTAFNWYITVDNILNHAARQTKCCHLPAYHYHYHCHLSGCCSVDV